jgi:non-canonical (house-cleaning) NTP pyrophosphatase
MTTISSTIFAIGSDNKAKISAMEMSIKQAFPSMQFSVVGVKVQSKVSDQPMSDSESITGARNRAKAALELVPNAEFGVGLEGIVHHHYDHR